MNARRWLLLAAVPVAAVAVVAGVVSYSHIEALGLATGQTLTDARLLPLAVDGLIVAGSVILLAGSRLGWIGVVPGVAATLFANVESGLPRGALAATISAWPAIAFTIASFMLERWLAGQAGARIRHGVADFGTVPDAVPGVPEPPEPPEPEQLVPDLDEELRRLTTYLATGNVPVIAVPAPPAELNGHAHQAAELFAADIAAGTVPGIRRIRSGLHVGQPKAEQVQAYLKTLTGTP